MTSKIELPLGRSDIEAYLPHRDPMLFVDRAIALDTNTIRIESDVKSDAPFFKGHFPDMPIMPGVLIIETIVQAGALLVALSHGLDEGQFLGFANIEEAKFKRPVYPNETMCVDVEIVKIRGPFYKFVGKAEVEGQIVATLKFAAAQMAFNQDDA